MGMRSELVHISGNIRASFKKKPFIKFTDISGLAQELDNSKLLSYLDKTLMAFLYLHWENLDLSEGSVQLHFMYEDNIYFYLDFHKEGLYLAIYSQDMFCQFKDGEFKPDHEMYKQAYSYTPPRWNRIFLSDDKSQHVCLGFGGHPLSIYVSHPETWGGDDDVWNKLLKERVKKRKSIYPP